MKTNGHARSSEQQVVGPLFAGVKKVQNSSCALVASRYIKPMKTNQTKNKGPYTIYVNGDAEYPQTETRLSDAISFAKGQVKCGNGIKVVDSSGKQVARVQRGSKWC